MKDKENERDAAERELSKHNLARIDERERHMVSIRPNYFCSLELCIDVAVIGWSARFICLFPLLHYVCSQPTLHTGQESN